MPDINLSPLTAEQSALDRRRKLAEAMQQQAILPIEMPNVPGARVSPYQGFAKLLQGYIAGKNLERADIAQKEYEANTMEDFAKVFGLAGQKETIPGAVTTPAVPSAPIPENVERQAELARLNQPEAGFEAQAAIGRNLMRPQDVQQIQNLPTSTAAVPEEREPSRQVPMLKVDMLRDPNFTKTSAGRMMLAQALMQQQSQQQAADLRKQEAEQAIVKFSPEETAGQFIGGKFVPLVTGKPKPMTEAQRLDAAIKLFGTRVEAQKAIDEGRVPLIFDPAELDIKPLPPQGTALQIGVVYDTPKGRLRWNGNKFTSVD
jgi:hypothetical protein